MKAPLYRKVWIMAQTVYYTLKISIYGLYMRFSRTYRRKHADDVLRGWSAFLLDIADASYEVFNPHDIAVEPGVPYIIMSNHRSLYDIPLIFVSVNGSIRMLTKKELFNIPVWGKGMKASEFISIDRHDHDQALKDLNSAREVMETGLAVWIAPEGTRSRNGRLGKFKKGGFMLALETGARIIPVGIRGSEKILVPDTYDFMLGQNVEVHIGKPIDAKDYGFEERDRLMDDVRTAIESLCGEA